jgi:uncharacterized integral membrane protein
LNLFRRVLAGAAFVALLVAGWRFAHSNGDPVRVDYLFGEITDVAMWQVLLSSVGLGVLVTALVLGLQLAASRLAARRTRKQLESLESEIHQLRNLPLTESQPRASAQASPRSSAQASAQKALTAAGGGATVNH